MNKHTPGPWFVDHKSPFLVRAGDDIDGRHIAHIGPANYTPRFDVDEPNARLIAAAPDLLEALECVDQETMLLARMKNCELRRGKGSFGIAVMDDELALEWQEYDKIRRALEDKRFAAIAKARGEA